MFIEYARTSVSFEVGGGKTTYSGNDKTSKGPDHTVLRGYKGKGNKRRRSEHLGLKSRKLRSLEPKNGTNKQCFRMVIYSKFRSLRRNVMFPQELPLSIIFP